MGTRFLAEELTENTSVLYNLSDWHKGLILRFEGFLFANHGTQTKSVSEIFHQNLWGQLDCWFHHITMSSIENICVTNGMILILRF